MASSKIDKDIKNARIAIERAAAKGIETAGLEAKLRKLEVKKNINKSRVR